MITPVCNLKISTDNPFLTEKKPKLVATTSLLYHLASLISRRSLHPEDLVTLDCCYACPTDAPVRALFSLSSELLLHFLSVNSCSPPSCKFLTLPRNVLVLPLIYMQARMWRTAQAVSSCSPLQRCEFPRQGPISPSLYFKLVACLLAWADPPRFHWCRTFSYSVILFQAHSLPSGVCLLHSAKKELAKYPLACLGPSPTVNSEPPSLSIPPDLWTQHAPVFIPDSSLSYILLPTQFHPVSQS